MSTEVRDRRQPGFWITDNELIEVYGRQIGPYGIAVYGALAMHAGQRGACEPSVSAIAAEIGMSTRKARDIIAALADVGLIGVERRPTGAGRNHETNVYSLLPVPKLAKYTGQPTAPGALPTALSAEPLRHDVPNPTALSAYKQDSARTEQENTSAPSGAGGPPPSADTDTPSPTPVVAGDRKTTPWEELGRDIAESLTGDGEKAFVKRGKRAGHLQAWVGDIVGMVGKAAADKPIAAYDVWLAFQESIPSEEWARYISRHNVGDRFGKWSQNGGQPAIRAAVAADEAWETRSVAS